LSNGAINNSAPENVVFKNPGVCSEPVIVETDKDGNNGLRADWGVRGFWEPQKQALFDVCILNADSLFLEHLTFLKSVLQKY
jgi:hypothetical protein